MTTQNNTTNNDKNTEQGQLAATRVNSNSSGTPRMYSMCVLSDSLASVGTFSFCQMNSSTLGMAKQ